MSILPSGKVPGGYYYVEHSRGAAIVEASSSTKARSEAQRKHDVYHLTKLEHLTYEKLHIIATAGGWIPFDLRDFVEEQGWVNSEFGVAVGNAPFQAVSPTN